MGGNGTDVQNASMLANDLVRSAEGISLLKEMFPELEGIGSMRLMYRFAYNQDGYISNGNSPLGMMGSDAARMNFADTTRLASGVVYSVFGPDMLAGKVAGIMGAIRDFSSHGNVNSTTLLKFYGDQWLAGDPPL